MRTLHRIVESFANSPSKSAKFTQFFHSSDFESLRTHATIVFMRQMFVARRVRMETDHRSFGDLFRDCCEEARDIDFMEVIYLTLAMESLEDGTRYCRKTAQKFINAIINGSANFLMLKFSVI